VEFGAANGRDLSNTFILERDYSWTGILAEPNPVWHSDLARDRHAKIDHRCVHRSSGQRMNFAATRYPELATLLDYLRADGHAASRQEHDVIEVETVSLNDLLASHDAPDLIDYISIDTEGSELEILEAFDFSRRDVRLFSIEHNGLARESSLDRLMADKGYERCYRGYSQMDGWYRRRNA